jgi:hypothetical protein
MRHIFLIFAGFILIINGVVLLTDKTQSKNCEEEKAIEYQRGYTDYQIDTYIPSPYLPTPSVEIPIKKRNPKLKEKFKG